MVMSPRIRRYIESRWADLIGKAISLENDTVPLPQPLSIKEGSFSFLLALNLTITNCSEGCENIVEADQLRARVLKLVQRFTEYFAER